MGSVPGHVHPVPDIETNVMPDGTDSVTATVPLVDPPLAPLETVTLYVAFCCPAAKLPECVLAMLNDGLIGTAAEQPNDSLVSSTPGGRGP